MIKDYEYKKILENFNILNYKEGKKIISEVRNSDDHINVTKLCKQYELVNPFDYMRSCNEANFIDFYINTVNEKIQPNSKYIISRRLTSNGAPVYLCNNNLENIFLEIKERYIDTGYYEKEKNRLKGYFVEENILRFGTKNSGYFIVEFEKGNINTLVKQKYYEVEKEHLNFQAQLCTLAAYFGYESKLARKEKNEVIYGINLNKIATLKIPDLEINNLKEYKSLEEIDFIDVIWSDKDTRKIVAAFEVELSGNWTGALDRFVSLKLACNDYGDEINFIILANTKHFANISSLAQMERYSRDFKTGQLKFLSIQQFIDILYKRDSFQSVEELKKEFFIKYLINLNVNSLLH